MRNLYLGVLLAPYRLDYYNYLYEHLNCDIYFQLKGFKGQLFSTEELEKKCNFTPNYLEITRLGGDRQMVWNLRKIIKQAKPQIVIVPEFSILTIQVILLKKLYQYKYKIVSQCDDSYHMLEHTGYSRFHGISRKICLPFLDELILLDNRATQWYQKHYHKGLFMPLIADENKIGTSKERVLNIAQKLCEQYNKDNCKIILFVGRLIEYKNLQNLLKACTKLQFPFKLIIVGDGEKRLELESLANQIQVNVEFVGRKNGIELYAWYCLADAFVLPSKLEPFGAVTNEALLFGCNCCVSSLAGSACLIKEGINGYLCNPNSIDDISDKITRTVNLGTTRDRKSKMPFSFESQLQHIIKSIM